MRLDILTPGSWQDSYESRFVSFFNEVSCFQDVLNVLKCEFEGNRHRSFDGSLSFNCYDVIIYNDEHKEVASWNFWPKTMELEVIPPTEFVKLDSDGRLWYREPFGKQRYMVPVYYPDRAYKSN